MRDIKEFRILDINAVNQGYNLFDLMNNAGKKLANHIKEIFSEMDLFLFVCGKGNNAGDGFIAASILCNEGFNVRVITSEKTTRSISKMAFSRYNGEMAPLAWGSTLPY